MWYPTQALGDEFLTSRRDRYYISIASFGDELVTSKDAFCKIAKTILFKKK